MSLPNLVIELLLRDVAARVFASGSSPWPPPPSQHSFPFNLHHYLLPHISIAFNDIFFSFDADGAVHGLGQPPLAIRDVETLLASAHRICAHLGATVNFASSYWIFFRTLWKRRVRHFGGGRQHPGSMSWGHGYTTGISSITEQSMRKTHHLHIREHEDCIFLCVDTLCRLMELKVIGGHAEVWDNIKGSPSPRLV